MPFSTVDIWNMALTNIGNTRIVVADPDENTEAAAVCRRYWAVVLQASLEMYEWSFATATEELAQSSDDPPSEWLYRYGLPTDCLKPRYVLEEDAPRLDNEHPARFEVQLNVAKTAKTLLTNLETCFLTYTANVTDPNLFSALFIQVLSWRLSAYLALKFAGRKITGLQCETMAQALVSGAARNDETGQRETYGDLGAGWISDRGSY